MKMNKASASAVDAQFMQQRATEVAALLRSLGNERRLLVLCSLMQHGECTPSELQDMVCLSQSALSQHLARMREEGLVEYRRESQTLYYRIGDPTVEKVISALKGVFCP